MYEGRQVVVIEECNTLKAFILNYTLLLTTLRYTTILSEELLRSYCIICDINNKRYLKKNKS